MACPKKIQTNILNDAIEEYFKSVNYNPKLLKYSLITNYLQLKNYNIKEYDIRRDKEVCEYIKQLKDKYSADSHLKENFVFKNLDVDELIKNNSSLPHLKRALIERDTYYSNLYDFICRINKDYLILDNKYDNLQKDHNTKLQEYDEKCLVTENLKSEIKLLKKENKILRNILKTNVYPEIANELLKEQGVLTGGNSYITPESKNKIISNSTSIVSFIKTYDNEFDKTNESDNNAVIKMMYDKI